MYYEDKLIYHECSGRNNHKFTKCKFMCERPDKNTILVEFEYAFSRCYMEISNNDIDNLYNLNKLTKHFEEENAKLQKEIDFLSKFVKDVPDIHEFNRHAKIIIGLLYEKNIWDWELKRNKKNENEKEICKSEKIVNQINKGIKRHNKRLYKSLVGYEDIELTRLYNAHEKIKELKEKIKNNETTFYMLKKYIES